MGRAVWAEERDIADAATLAAIASEQGIDAAALARARATADIRVTVRGADAGGDRPQVFGAPTYVYRDELFWGQDRLDFLDRKLAK